MIGGIISGIGNVAGAIIGAKQANKNVDKQIRHQSELAEYQYNKDLEMWHLQNQYNAPDAQMERYKAAGLNPNMIYGKGGSAGNATQLPKYQAPKVDYSMRRNPMDFLGQMSLFQDLKMKSAQIDNLKEQRDLTAEQKLTEVVERSLKGAQRLLTKRRASGELDRSNSAFYDAEMKRELAEYSKEFAKTALEQRKAEIREKTLSGSLKGVELEWIENMKKTKMGAQLAPLMRMFLLGK